MNFEKLILSRRTVHNFTKDSVPEKIIEQALSLSLWSMNHKLTFPWVYISVGPEARDKLADLSVELRSAKEPVSDVKIKAIRDNILNPAHLIAIGIKLTGEAKREHEDYAALSAAVQIASLVLWENGIASKWSTGGYSTNSRTYEILEVDPQAIRLEGALMVGVAREVPPAPKRPSLESVWRKTK